MGIDKPDVRYVIHAGHPRSLESYAQQVGRGGRDGKQSFCRMYWTANDMRRLGSENILDGVLVRRLPYAVLVLSIDDVQIPCALTVCTINTH
jgi:Lhr-like helicase